MAGRRSARATGWIPLDQQLRRLNLVKREVMGDGNCLIHAAYRDLADDEGTTTFTYAAVGAVRATLDAFITEHRAQLRLSLDYSWRLRQLPARGARLWRVASPVARPRRQGDATLRPLSQEWSALGGAAHPFVSRAKWHGGRGTLDARVCAYSPRHHMFRARVRARVTLYSTRRVKQCTQAAVCVPCARRRSL